MCTFCTASNLYDEPCLAGGCNSIPGLNFLQKIVLFCTFMSFLTWEFVDFSDQFCFRKGGNEIGGQKFVFGSKCFGDGGGIWRRKKGGEIYRNGGGCFENKCAVIGGKKVVQIKVKFLFFTWLEFSLFLFFLTLEFLFLLFLFFGGGCLKTNLDWKRLA